MSPVSRKNQIQTRNTTVVCAPALPYRSALPGRVLRFPFPLIPFRAMRPELVLVTPRVVSRITPRAPERAVLCLRATHCLSLQCTTGDILQKPSGTKTSALINNVKYGPYIEIRDVNEKPLVEANILSSKRYSKASSCILNFLAGVSRSCQISQYFQCFGLRLFRT